jgi:hypothetical protein
VSYAPLGFYASVAVWEGEGQKKDTGEGKPFLQMGTEWIGYRFLATLTPGFSSHFSVVCARQAWVNAISPVSGAVVAEGPTPRWEGLFVQVHLP